MRVKKMKISQWFALERMHFAVRSPNALQFGLLNDIQENISEKMSNAWKIFLFGNGSPTQHLALLTGYNTQVNIISMDTVTSEMPLSAEVASQIAYDAMKINIPEPHTQRQVWLTNTNKEILGYAVTWLREGDEKILFSDASIPIGQNIAKVKMELFRDIQSVFSGENADLEAHFGKAGPFPGRSYLFRYQNRPIAFIYEVFSPAMEAYLGPVLYTPINPDNT